jgi:hypothetical protein
MRELESTIRNNELREGRIKEGAHTESFNLFAPAWKTIRQSNVTPSKTPLGTAKYFIRDLT